MIYLESINLADEKTSDHGLNAGKILLVILDSKTYWKRLRFIADHYE
jgi:hypothetical protein